LLPPLDASAYDFVTLLPRYADTLLLTRCAFSLDAATPRRHTLATLLPYYAPSVGADAAMPPCHAIFHDFFAMPCRAADAYADAISLFCRCFDFRHYDARRTRAFD